MQKLYQEAEKFIKGEFWNNTHDPHSKLNLPKLIEEKLIKDNLEKDPAYYEHREGIVHSTSLAKCLRGVVHEMLGAKKDNEMEPRKLGIFKAGNLFEDFIIAALGNRVIHAQREYEYHYKSITLVGRSDYTIEDEGVMRVGENKSVHSDSFWMREKEGTLIAWHNQVQLETYLWLERILTPYQCSKCKKVILSNYQPRCAQCDNEDPLEPGDVRVFLAPDQKINNPQGIFSYISKDDCTVVGAPVKFNQNIIDQIVIPALDIINEAYEKKDPNLAPLPDMVIFNESKHQYQKNWLCTYCDYHSSCQGAGWILEAANAVTVKNRELKSSMDKYVVPKKEKPQIEVVGVVGSTEEIKSG